MDVRLGLPFLDNKEEGLDNGLRLRDLTPYLANVRRIYLLGIK